MSDDLLDLAVVTTGGQELWKTLRGLRIDISIGGPIWAMKGWPPDKTFDQILAVGTVNEHILFTPFTPPDQRMVFDAGTDSVTMETLDGQPVDTLAPTRAAFKGMLRDSAWGTVHLGYFLGYSCWNYFTTPFLFTYPGVRAHEIQPWREAGQTWRRLQVRFPPQIATHNPDQVFYFDTLGMQRRRDYIVEVNGSPLVGHYTSRYQNFDGLLAATHRRVFRRNPDNTVNFNLPSIILGEGLSGRPERHRQCPTRSAEHPTQPSRPGPSRFELQRAPSLRVSPPTATLDRTQER